MSNIDIDNLRRKRLEHFLLYNNTNNTNNTSNEEVINLENISCDEVNKNINNTDEDVCINSLQNNIEPNFLSKIYNSGASKIQTTLNLGYKLGTSIKDGINTFKQDFFQDTQQNYTYIRNTYRDINRQRNELYQQRLQNIQTEHYIRHPPSTLNNIDSIYYNSDEIDRIINVSKFYENIFNLMIEEHVREQQEWLNDVEHIRLNNTEYNKLIKTNIMCDNLLTDIDIESNSCSICQEEIIKGEFCDITPCNHLYHSKCSKEWFINKCIKPTCPICRTDIREN